jgi:molybdenum cofactor cytidylyltransferase
MKRFLTANIFKPHDAIAAARLHRVVDIPNHTIQSCGSICEACRLFKFFYLRKKIIMKTVFSAVVLAAGSSGRMGVPKMGLRFDENCSFVENICAKFNSFGCDKIIVVVSEAGDEYLKEKKFSLPQNTQIVVNHNPEYGRFFSLKTGLGYCLESQNVFFTNVDNPFVDIKTLNCLAEQNAEFGYVCPVFKGRGGHPVLLSNKVVGAIIKEEGSDFILKDFLQKYHRIEVDVDDEKIIANINTPEEFQKYFGEIGV